MTAIKATIKNLKGRIDKLMVGWGASTYLGRG